MAHHLFIVLSDFFRRYGYWTVFVATFLENMCIPVPGEAPLLFAGFLARRSELHLLWAVLAAIAGSIAGESVGYEIGRWGGKAILERLQKRFFIPARTYERSQAVFLKQGGWVILVARFVSGLRELVGIIAGIYRMPVPRFMLFNSAGAVLWSIAMGCIGYFLGGSWRHLLHFFTRINTIAVVLFLAVVAFLIVRSRSRRRKQE